MDAAGRQMAELGTVRSFGQVKREGKMEQARVSLRRRNLPVPVGLSRGLGSWASSASRVESPGDEIKDRTTDPCEMRISCR